VKSDCRNGCWEEGWGMGSGFDTRSALQASTCRGLSFSLSGGTRSPTPKP